MNINDIRRLNLDHLIGNRGEHGRIAEFARRHNLDPSYLSQILNKNRNLGEKSARNLELVAGLPPGDLDKPMANEVSESAASYIAQQIGDDAVALLQSYLEASPELRVAALRVLQTPPPSRTTPPKK